MHAVKNQHWEGLQKEKTRSNDCIPHTQRDVSFGQKDATADREVSGR